MTEYPCFPRAVPGAATPFNRGFAVFADLAGPGDDFEAVVGVTIRKDGNIDTISFEKQSGNRFFDESVLKAVKKASPFPGFPESLREETLDVGIRFLSSEFS